jgi:hypothetical protein
MTKLDGAVWRASSRSSAAGNCVEVAHLDEVVAVRDSKDRHGPVLVVNRASWTEFVAHLKR